MANKELESTVLSIEVETSVDKEGNPKFTKKKLGNLVPGADPNKVMAVGNSVESGKWFLNEDINYLINKKSL